MALAPSNAVLNTEEQGLSGNLFRMRPGDQTKELLASQVTGFVEAEGQIYYASNGTILKAESGNVLSGRGKSVSNQNRRRYGLFAGWYGKFGIRR